MTKRFKFFLPIMICAGIINVALGEVLFPKSLREGDKVALLAPSGPVKLENVEGAVEVIRAQGFEPVVFPSVYKELGQFAGTPEERFADLKEAFSDTEIRAVVCARGGYGAVHLLDSLAALPLRDDPKWLVGFSDITAIHGLMASKEIASIHGPMALHISRGADQPENQALFDIFRGNFPSYEFPPDSMNHIGHAEGRLLGGNFSVIEGLVNTPYDLIQPGTILFIEDIAEEIYKLQRMMYRLKLSGALSRLGGLVIGQFTKIPKGQNYDSVEPMIRDILVDYPDLPVAFNIPIGHIRHNVPVIESAPVSFTVSPSSVTLDFSPPAYPIGSEGTSHDDI